MMSIPDLTIRFHRSQWDELPEAAKVLIGTYCGPLWPDADGVLTMVVSEMAWAAISACIEENKPRRTT